MATSTTTATILSTDNSTQAVPDTFQQLVAELSLALESSSGLTIADVDHTVIEQLMHNYKSSKQDWERYAFADASRGYTRNLVDAGKGKSNLLVLVWTPGKGSPIHDHADAHCVMKVLQGTLQETLYDWPDEDVLRQGSDAPLPITRQRCYGENAVTYMSDQLGLHRISNPDAEKIAVSLHRERYHSSDSQRRFADTQAVYTPPNAARHGCHIFDERTGAQSHVQQCHFYSEYGHKL